MRACVHACMHTMYVAPSLGPIHVCRPMYVCMYVRTHARTHVRTCVCIHVYVRTYVCTYARTHARTHVRTYVCIHVCMYMYVCTCMYVHVCMYMYVCTCTKQTANYLLNGKLKLHNNMGTDGCCCCSAILSAAHARPSLICCQTQQPRIGA